MFSFLHIYAHQNRGETKDFTYIYSYYKLNIMAFEFQDVYSQRTFKPFILIPKKKSSMNNDSMFHHEQWPNVHQKLTGNFHTKS